jgi:hypothetical protein
MDRPATDPLVPQAAAQPTGTDAGGAAGAEAPTDWLIDADDPLLTPDRLARVADPARPDRLAWNTFRTLALWDTDAWVPRLLELACGADVPIVTADWTRASVTPWAVGPFETPDAVDVVDVVLDGPEAYVVLACDGHGDPSEEQLRAGAIAALDGSLREARLAGLVVVVPPGTEGVDDRLQVATETELMDGRIAIDLMGDAIGWVSWTDVARIALDLAEEGDPDVAPVDMVHELVTELQQLYPDATI